MSNLIDFDALEGSEQEYFESQRFTDEYAREKAERLGLDILYSDETSLQLDLDSLDAFKLFVKRLNVAIDVGLIPRVFGYEEMTSKSGNTHVVISKLAPMTVEQRIMLQAALGSDPTRELLALAGYRKGQKNPILLFRPRPKEALPDASD